MKKTKIPHTYGSLYDSYKGLKRLDFFLKSSPLIIFLKHRQIAFYSHLNWIPSGEWAPICLGTLKKQVFIFYIYNSNWILS